MSRRGWVTLAAVLVLLLCAGLALCFAGPMVELLRRITAWLVETVFLNNHGVAIGGDDGAGHNPHARAFQEAA